MKKLDEWDKELKRAATGSKAQVSQLGQDLVDMNYDDWTEGESYESLVKRYQGEGKKAMDDTIGQVAARTGGLASSYAAQAGQQAYGGWMENLENAARSLYDTERQELMDRYNIANDMYTQQRDEARYIDERDYQRGRDAIADQRYATEWDYQRGRDAIADQRYATEWDYQRGRDAIADQRYTTEWDYKISQDTQATTDERREDIEERILNAAYYGLADWDDMYEDAKMAGMTKADFDRLVAQAQAAKQESVVNNSTSAYDSYINVSVSAFEDYVDRLIKDEDADDATIAEGIAKYIILNYGEDIKEEQIPEVQALLDAAKRKGIDVDNIW